jgi:hypothetical protein
VVLQCCFCAIIILVFLRIRDLNMDKRNFKICFEKQKNYHMSQTYATRCMRIESELVFKYEIYS